jgi:hypothetical protein
VPVVGTPATYGLTRAAVAMSLQSTVARAGAAREKARLASSLTLRAPARASSVAASSPSAAASAARCLVSHPATTLRSHVAFTVSQHMMPRGAPHARQFSTAKPASAEASPAAQLGSGTAATLGEGRSGRLDVFAPSARGLYDASLEHDSCGVGFVVDIKGERVIGRAAKCGLRPRCERCIIYRAATRLCATATAALSLQACARTRPWCRHWTR